jgi:very-short-patch-repair endonuclease
MCKELLLILEADGGIHETTLQKEKDERRDRKLKAIGFTVLRYKNWEILYCPDDVYVEIKRWVEEKMKRGE